MEKEITLIIEIRRCVTCHASENLVRFSKTIRNTTMRRYFICRPHASARNAKYYYKNKYKGSK